MPRLHIGTTLLFVFVNVPACLQADTVGSVTVSVCNSGKTDVDAFFSLQNQVTAKHVGPADCAVLAKAERQMAPGYVGIAFVDAKGQWGAARRQDLLPELGSGGILQRSTQTATVKHGAASVSLPMQLLLRPAIPTCSYVGGESFTARNNLPLGATASQRWDAKIWDEGHSTPGELVCQQLVYELIVEAYPDTKELTFRKYCDSCDKKWEASLTPEQRAAAQQRLAAYDAMVRNIGATPGIGRALAGVMNLGKEELAKQEQAEAAEVAPAIRVNWSDMTLYLYLAFREDHRMKPVNRHIVVQGTVQSVSVSSPNTPDQRFNVYFKEDLKHQFAFCESSPDIFRDLFGPNYATTMVGKLVEVEGTVARPCHDANAGIQVSLARQLRVIGPGVAPLAAHVWTPADNPIPATNPDPAPSAASAAPRPSARPRPPMNPQEAARAAAARPMNRNPAQPAPNPAPVATASAATASLAPARVPVAPPQPVPNPAPVAAASVAPARAPVAPAQQAPAAPVRRDPIINTVIRLLKAKSPPEISILLLLKQLNKPLNVTEADRVELENAGASEKLIDAMVNPASIGPEVTREAAAAAARQNAASQRTPR